MGICGDCAWCSNGMYCRKKHKEVGYFATCPDYTSEEGFIQLFNQDNKDINQDDKKLTQDTNKMAEYANTKVCKECGRELPIEQFRPNPKAKDGHLNTCYDCMNKKTSRRRKEEVSEQEERSFIRASNTISNALDQELVDELRARGWDVTCKRVIEL